MAVLAVVLFHAWPGLLAGGFIGVDVFFVISGFLITGLLTRELERNGTISFRAFYVRRIRRLFPAAALALAATFLLSAWLLSPLALPRVTTDGLAAALSVANIRFAFTTGDYFDAVVTPSPFLHYWSLSVEEQFYLLWPALLLAAHRLGGARGLVVAVAVVAVVSFGLAVLATDVASSWAFFSLPTRAWQLAAGGLLALAALSRYRRSAFSALLATVGWVGLAMVFAAGVRYDELLAYPGAWALVPTFGAVAIIAGGDRRLGPGRFLQLPPMRFLGRISYALYLWHWPLLVLPAVALGGELPQLARLALVMLAISVATLSTLLVEEPIRGRTLAGPARGWLGMAARPLLGLVVAVVIGAGASHWISSSTMADLEREYAAATVGDSGRLPPDVEGDAVIEGFDRREQPAPREPRASLPRSRPQVTEDARARPTPRPTPKPRDRSKPARAPQPTAKAVPKTTPKPRRTPKPTPDVRLPRDLRPRLWNAADDVESLKKNGCLQAEAVTSPRSCVFGRTGSRYTVALVGDSHASHWFPALRRVALERGWRLETYVKVSCPFTDILVRNLEKKKRYKECLAFNQNVVRRLNASRPDVVITALSRWQHPVEEAYASPQAQGEGIARMLAQVPGRKVVIADVPYPGQDVPECLASHRGDIRKCAIPAHGLVSGGSPARERQAARSVRGVMLDFNDLICSGRPRCPVVRNGLVIFRDHHHLTATFARSLAPALDRALQKVVPKRMR